MSKDQESLPLWKQLKTFWACSLVVLLLYAFGLPARHYAVCSPQNSNEIVPGRITATSESTTKNSSESEVSRGLFPFSMYPHQATKRESTTGTYYPPEQPHTWWQAVLCDVNASDYFVGLFTLVLAISTIGLWIATFRMSAAGDEQIKAVQASVDAVKLTEMARVMVNGIGLGRYESGKPFDPKFKVLFQNYGKTPGFVHSTTLRFAVNSKDVDLENFANVRTGGTVNNGFPLSPGVERGHTNQYGTTKLTADEMTALMLPRARLQLFVWGEVIFSPVFDEKWVSQFAFRINLTPDANPPLKNVTVGGAKFWRFYKIEKN
jgi:hypothetical protein